MGRLAFRIVFAVLGVIWLSGCGAKLNIEQTKELSLSEVITQPLDAYKKEQKITITVSATNPVDVFVYLDKDKDAAEAAINAKKDDKLLAVSRMLKDGKLEAPIPANSPATIMIAPAGKSAKVTYKVTNQ